MADNIICEIEGCGNKRRARGWCTMHWNRWRKHGDPNLGAKKYIDKTCGVNGCKSPPRIRLWDGVTYCNTHEKRMRNNGTVELKCTKLKTWFKCSVEGCNRDSRTSLGKLCELHYGRHHRFKSFDLPLKSYEYKDKKGYEYIPDRNHPLANSNGMVYTHRKVVYDSLNGKDINCSWCNKHLKWFTCNRDEKLIIDHLDGDKSNNSIDNLKPSCFNCNAARGLFQGWIVKYKNHPLMQQIFKSLIE